jgi:hypothetical protein
MCKAHVLRFRCSHGVLMALQPCRTGPCPMLKMTGTGLPPQPYRCYNCQHKAEQNAAIPTSSRHSNTSVNSSTDSISSSSTLSSSPPRFSPPRPSVSHPLPGVAVQPTGCVRISRAQSSGKSFGFSCKSSDHYPTPHYIALPTYLPHQDHPCPPCQLEDLRVQADQDVARSARAEFPSLKDEMLVHDGRTWDPEIMSKPTIEKYIEERRTEEREMWFHVTRKWTQDLKRARVLVAEEDGLGLLG